MHIVLSDTAVLALAVSITALVITRLVIRYF